MHYIHYVGQYVLSIGTEALPFVNWHLNLPRSKYWYHMISHFQRVNASCTATVSTETMALSDMFCSWSHMIFLGARHGWLQSYGDHLKRWLTFFEKLPPPNMTRSFRKKWLTWRSCQVFSWTGDYLTWSKLSSSLLTPCLGQACLDTTWSHNDIIEGFNTIKGGNGNKIRTMKYGMRSLRRCKFEDMHNPLLKKCWQCFFCSSSTPTS